MSASSYFQGVNNCRRLLPIAGAAVIVGLTMRVLAQPADVAPVPRKPTVDVCILQSTSCADVADCYGGQLPSNTVCITATLADLSTPQETAFP